MQILAMSSLIMYIGMYVVSQSFFFYYFKTYLSSTAVVQVEVKSPPHFGILMMLSKTDDEWV